MRIRIAAVAVVLFGVGALIYGAYPTYTPKNTAVPTLTGSGEVGQDVACDPGTWSHTPTQYTITWQRSADGSSGWSDIATGSPYSLGAVDDTKYIRCHVTGSNAGGTQTGQALSANAGPVTTPATDVFVLDDFTDVDGTNLTAHTGQIGATWAKTTNQPGSARDIFVTANRSRGDGNSTLISRYYASGTPPDADYAVTATLRAVGTASKDVAGLWARASATTDDGYTFQFNRQLGTFRLSEIVSGSATLLGSCVDTFPVGEEREAELEVVGTTITGSVDSIVCASVTDTSFTSAGVVAIATRHSTDTLGTHIDSIEARDVVAAAPECSDGIDNADPEDALVDFPVDPGCTSGADDDEIDPPAPGDSEPPSNPTNLAETNDTQTSITVSWTASTDNVAVTGYGLYRNAALEAEIAPGTSFEFLGLVCGTSYTLGVDAFDAAENRSGQASALFATEDCPPVGNDPANLFVSLSGSDTGSNCVRFSTPVEAPASKATWCKTFNKAYDLAGSGDRVSLDCDQNFLSQTITPAGASTKTDYVTFRGAVAGCLPTVGAGAPGTSGTFLSATYHPDDATINVESTDGFNTASSLNVGPHLSAITCTGKTATQFTGCGATSNETLYHTAGTGVSQGALLRIDAADWVRFDGLTAGSVDGSHATSGTAVVDHVEFLNGTSRSMNFWRGGNDILVQHWVIGKNIGGKTPTNIYPMSGGPQDGEGPIDITFDTVTWTETNATGCIDAGNDDCHSSAITIRSGDGVTIRKSIFYKPEGNGAINVYRPISSHTCTSPCASTHWALNVLIELNFFSDSICKTSAGSETITYPCTGTAEAISISNGPRILANWIVQYNTFSDRSTMTTNHNGISNVVWRANYGRGFGTCPSFTFTDNVWVDGACSASDIGSAAYSVVSALTGDLHLSPGAPAIGNGDPASCPPLDIDGEVRPEPDATTCDASADEVS